jgi:hypothetical protein
MTGDSDRSQPTLRIAILVPIVIALCFGLWIELTWGTTGCRQPGVDLPGPLKEIEIIVGVPVLLLGWFTWRRGQPIWIISLQVLLSLVLTLVLAALVIWFTQNLSECYS